MCNFSKNINEFFDLEKKEELIEKQDSKKINQL